jgi:preprotein translocase subunit SecA
MMKGIAQDFVRYVMHVQVVQQEAMQPLVQNLLQSKSDAQSPLGGATPQAALNAVQQASSPSQPRTIVNDAWSKTPRNAPCPCGSGKKFKMCHGAS